MLENENNISGISENLSESIEEKELNEKDQVNFLILRNKKIAISVSESEELEELGLSNQHLKDMSIEIARYLIVNGAKLLYGGDLRNDGYTDLFSELSYQYKYLHDKEFSLLNYFPFPNAKDLTTNAKAKLREKQVDVKILDVPDSLGKLDPLKFYNPKENIEDRYHFAECFSDMRLQMAKVCDARIVVGGKQNDFTGYFPGIVEEALYSLKVGKPVYLLGGFGGATKSIIEMISGNRPIQMTNEYQFNSDFLIAFREYSFGMTNVITDYDYLFEFFSRYTLDEISRNNGLSVEENQILFESVNIHEIVFLIIKGLKKI